MKSLGEVPHDPEYCRVHNGQPHLGPCIDDTQAVPETRLSRYVADLIRDAPPLTEEQITTLRNIFRRHGDDG